ncbi:uncharacterized protein LOC119590437 [Penaeus monodon]|uniref:uncharacterized protein LOC119590437 n=1 Tax=Penaeus monodon TaxID=6687 RepID=UPI0018A6F887|nr:uncharacterized protein LOC119590437 [Penaeus monodon]
MKFAVAVLVCLAAAVVAHADPEPHYFRSPYNYYPHYYYRHHIKPLKGDGVAKHPGGGTSFVAPRVHGLKKRSADPMPEANPEPAADPEPTADPDPSKSYSYQVVHHGYPRYGYHHGYRYPYYGYRYSHHYGYPYTYHKHHKRSADPEPEAEPHYSYYGYPHYYKGYYHGYPHTYPYYAGYRYRYRGKDGDHLEGYTKLRTISGKMSSGELRKRLEKYPTNHEIMTCKYRGFTSNPQRRPVLSEPTTGPAMKFAVAVLVCLAAAVVTQADPEPHKYHRYPYYHYYPHYHHVEPLEGDGVARHPGGGTSFVAPQVHGLTKRSADPMPNPEPAADPDPSKSYSYQVVHYNHPHYGYRYPYYGYRYSHHYGYPYTYHKHHKRSADPEPEAEPHYSYYGYPHYYKGYYHGYPHRYPYYAGYRYRYRG